MLVLASASPRRKELLERIGVPIEVRPADVDETQAPGEAPLAYVRRVAAAKAAAFAGGTGWVLAADTIVELDGEIFGKAGDAVEARAMLARLRGRRHRVTTAWVLRGGAARVVLAGEVTTEVAIVDASDAELDDYVESGEWRGKAGAYAVQGIAAALVSEIHGSITNVIGLPLAEIVAALRAHAALGAPSPRFAAGSPA
jgi:septum formation protein